MALDFSSFKKALSSLNRALQRSQTAPGDEELRDAILQAKIQKLIKKTDTCGVLYLHGLPGLLGGIAALFAVEGIQVTAQITGIVIAVGLALVGGFIVGKIVSLTGGRRRAYEDAEEFLTEESEVHGKKAAA